MTKSHRLCVFFFLSIMFFGIFPLIRFDQKELFLKINGYNNKFLDIFFYNITFLGNGYIYILFLVTLFLKKTSNRTLFAAGIALVFITIIIKSLKYFFFVSELRPSSLIDTTNATLHIINKIKLKTHSSFPSGHAAIIFAMASFVILHFNFNFYNILITFIIAILVSYSRVYLVQHFYKDVYFGGLIGGGMTIFSYISLKNFPYFNSLLDTNLIDLFLMLYKKN